MPAETLRLELTMVPDASKLSTTRRLVDELSSQFAIGPDICWRLAMATYELLENAFKYGTNELASLTVEIQTIDGVRTAGVSVRNRSRTDHLDVLRRTADAIARAVDPWAFYIEAMTETSRRSDRSGLGLARIWGEAEMSLRISFEGDDYVRIGADLPVEAGS